MQTEIDEDYKEQVQHVLRSGIADVFFTKKDGTKRRMLCTTKESLIPEKAFGNPKDWNYPESLSETARAKNPDIAVIWDLEKDAWRSFRYDSVISFATKVNP